MKAALPLLPGASSLPFVPGGGGEIPSGLELELKGVRPERDRVADYAKVCGFRLREELPPTFPHILAFPLHMAVMSDGRFPFGAVGLVHIENTITRHRPVTFEDAQDIRVGVSRLKAHPKGQSFSLLTEVGVEGETVWTETSTMLRRGKTFGEEQAEPAPFPTLGAETPASATWRLSGDLGRRYGAVSGDRNPIHMHALTARPLGFDSAIAHGMWTLARSLAQLENRLPDSFTVAARFRRPIHLPGRVGFASGDEGERTLFSVRDAGDGTPHLDGTIDPLPTDTAKASV